MTNQGPQFPSWWKEGDLDPPLLSSVLGYSVDSARLEPFSHHGGTVANLKRLVIRRTNHEECSTFIVKQLPDSSLSRSLELGLTRECEFFMWLKQQQQQQQDKLTDAGVVACEYATFDASTGQKLMVLHDLSKSMEGRWTMMQSHPFCAHDDIPKLLAEYENVPTPLEAVTATFCTLAKFHAAFWKSDSENSGSYKEKSWCRGSQWLLGKDRESWEKEQDITRNVWSQTKDKAKDNWNPKVFNLVDASISKVNWENAVQQLEKEAVTLCHGDFWPANVMLERNESGALVPTFIDWELVTLGSGRQDLAAFMLNVNVEFRRNHQDELLHSYVEELNRNLLAAEKSPVTFEETLEGYINGGAAKICWMLPLLATFGPAFETFFHDVALAWFEDFDLTAATVPQPRL